MYNKIKRLGDYLVESQLISQDQLSEALRLQLKTNKKLGQILVEEGFISEKQILEVLEQQLGIQRVNLDNYNIDSSATKLVNERLARKHAIIPLRIDHNKLILAMADPLNIFAIDDVKLATGFDVEPVIATNTEIEVAIQKYYQKIGAEKALEEFSENFVTEFSMDQDSDEMLENIANAPVVKLVNNFIAHAVKMKASDIHIEPLDKHLRIRFRIDGELMEIMSLEKSSHAPIVTRIKIMGHMDIAEKRVPQDGRVEMVVDSREIDMRLSVYPTVYGEKIVIRLLDRSGDVMSKEQLGFTDDNLEMFKRIIQHPHGIILVTGPTGSGKTTTLYAALRDLNTIDTNIITIEDPVEYHLSGISQSQINLKAGLSFASGLRSILRQDPNIIMVGEIRDQETAQIAVRAAITGHLVLSTIHTNDTASTVARLVDMGIEPYLIASSVVGIIAQRLVRKICTKCKVSYTASTSHCKSLGLPTGLILYRGEGCNLCNHTGHSGRMAIHEVLPVTNRIREAIETKQTTDMIKQIAKEQGMQNLRSNCLELVIKGVITVDELFKMTFDIEN